MHLIILDQSIINECIEMPGWWENQFLLHLMHLLCQLLTADVMCNLGSDIISVCIGNRLLKQWMMANVWSIRPCSVDFLDGGAIGKIIGNSTFLTDCLLSTALARFFVRFE